jgi:hypothetical protein
MTSPSPLAGVGEPCRWMTLGIQDEYALDDIIVSKPITTCALG